MTQKRVALVTGGLGGIGTAICRGLQKQGCTVVTTYARNGERLDKWQAAQKDAGYEKFYAYPCDVSNWDNCVALKKTVEDELGGVDIVVNNAGITRDSRFQKMTPQMWDEVIVTNLSSVFYVSRQFVDGMVERGFGRVINISSINAQKGQFGQVNYAAAKAGMHGFTKSLAQEVVKKGV
ncbi:MAG: SDR family NAD(P)-dependent oxidoreductase, partial [Gammaproteobacteria bacterium WSBS_2016_MAG_OTU1]